MERFQHMMRTTQHTKSVEMIMTRTHGQFFGSKSPRKKLACQGDNITTYLRKFQIDRQNLNLAKRIMQCQSQHSRNKYIKQWENIKRFLRVRSNFKKTLHAKEPKIYRYQPILGKGKLKIDMSVIDIQAPTSQFSRKNLYKFSFLLGSNQIQPDKKLITMDFIKNYNTNFYAPLYLSKKKITCKIFQIHQNNYYESGRFQIDLSLPGYQQAQIMNKFCKTIGVIKININVEGNRKKLNKKSILQKQNLPEIKQQKLPVLKQQYHLFKKLQNQQLQKDYQLELKQLKKHNKKTNYCSQSQA